MGPLLKRGMNIISNYIFSFLILQARVEVWDSGGWKRMHKNVQEYWAVFIKSSWIFGVCWDICKEIIPYEDCTCSNRMVQCLSYLDDDVLHDEELDKELLWNLQLLSEVIW